VTSSEGDKVVTIFPFSNGPPSSMLRTVDVNEVTMLQLGI